MYEKEVCEELHCVAYTMKLEGKNWKKDKDIVNTSVKNVIETDYSSYELGDNVQPPTVDLNKAPKDQLIRLSEVGDVKAEAIIEYRKAKKFKKLNDLNNVEGIGPSTVDAIKKQKLFVIS